MHKSIDLVLKKDKCYSNNIDLINLTFKTFKFLLDTEYVSNNLSNVQEKIFNLIVAKIEEGLEKEIINYNELSSFLLTLNDYKKIYVSPLILYEVHEIMKENDNDVVEFVSAILEDNYLFIDKQIIFNYELLVSFEKLSSDQISEKTEEYKTLDGRYIYEGGLFSREELEKNIEERYIMLVIQFKYAINQEKTKLYQIDYSFND